MLNISLTENDFIKIWRFENAPKKYAALSENGGDEDWVCLIPATMARYQVPWIQHPSKYSLGISDIEKHELPNGDVVYIGSHV